VSIVARRLVRWAAPNYSVNKRRVADLQQSRSEVSSE